MMYHIEYLHLHLQNRGEGNCNYYNLVSKVEKEYKELDDALKVKSMYEAEITKCNERSQCPCPRYFVRLIYGVKILCLVVSYFAGSRVFLVDIGQTCHFYPNPTNLARNAIY
jgi:hypothetical protein